MKMTWEEYARQRDAEVIVLKHDVERLTAELAEWKSAAATEASQRRHLTAENERLRAALERLLEDGDWECEGEFARWSPTRVAMEHANEVLRTYQQQTVNSEE